MRSPPQGREASICITLVNPAVGASPATARLPPPYSRLERGRAVLAGPRRRPRRQLQLISGAARRRHVQAPRAGPSSPLGIMGPRVLLVPVQQRRQDAASRSGPPPAAPCSRKRPLLSQRDTGDARSVRRRALQAAPSRGDAAHRGRDCSDEENGAHGAAAAHRGGGADPEAPGSPCGHDNPYSDSSTDDTSTVEGVACGRDSDGEGDASGGVAPPLTNRCDGGDAVEAPGPAASCEVLHLDSDGRSGAECSGREASSGFTSAGAGASEASVVRGQRRRGRGRPGRRAYCGREQCARARGTEGADRRTRPTG